MKLSAPIYVLKSKARALKKSSGLSMNQALDTVAKEEGFNSWSLLASKAKDVFPKKKEEILNFLNPGDLMLIASRPGLRKTTFTLEVLIQAVNAKRKCYFFSLEYNFKDIVSRVADIDESIGANNEYIQFDFSDEISSEYIIERTNSEEEEGFLIGIDYLQLLDQNRSKPELQKQIEELKEYARQKKCIILFISQVDRSFEESSREMPLLSDIRLPNPVDLKLFNKNIFLHNGELSFNGEKSFIVD